MGYYLSYIIKGNEDKLLKNISIKDKQYYFSLDKNDQNGFIEGKLLNGKIEFCYPQIKYSWFLNKDPDILKKVQNI